MKGIIGFIKKEGVLEYEKGYLFWSILLYIITTTFLVYTTIGKPEDFVWNGFFWVTQIFVCVNVVSKSFIGETRENLNYFYLLVSAQEFVISKLVYNLFLTFIFISITLVVFLFFLGVPNISLLKFWVMSLFAGMGFSNTFTFISAIAAKAKQGASFVTILGFPLIIPQLMLMNKFVDAVFSDYGSSSFLFIGGILLLINVMTFVLAVILYPFLWGD